MNFSIFIWQEMEWFVKQFWVKTSKEGNFGGLAGLPFHQILLLQKIEKDQAQLK